jgi:hypothetical protein
LNEEGKGMKGLIDRAEGVGWSFWRETRIGACSRRIY